MLLSGFSGLLARLSNRKSRSETEKFRPSRPIAHNRPMPQLPLLTREIISPYWLYGVELIKLSLNKKKTYKPRYQPEDGWFAAQGHDTS